MAVKVEYRCLHVPEQCTYESHQKRFVAVNRVRVFTTLDDCVKQLCNWNNACACWQYVLLSKEVTSEIPDGAYSRVG